VRIAAVTAENLGQACHLVARPERFAAAVTWSLAEARA